MVKVLTTIVGVGIARIAAPSVSLVVLAAQCKSRLPRGGALGAAYKGHLAFSSPPFWQGYHFHRSESMCSSLVKLPCVQSMHGSCFSTNVLLMCAVKIAFWGAQNRILLSPPAAGGRHGASFGLPNPCAPPSCPRDASRRRSGTGLTP